MISESPALVGCRVCELYWFTRIILSSIKTTLDISNHLTTSMILKGVLPACANQLPSIRSEESGQHIGTEQHDFEEVQDLGYFALT